VKKIIYCALLYVAQQLLYKIDENEILNLISSSLFSNILNQYDEMSYNEKTILHYFFNILIQIFDIDPTILNESGILDFLFKTIDVFIYLEKEKQIVFMRSLLLLKSSYAENSLDEFFKTKLYEYGIIEFLEDSLESIEIDDELISKIQSTLSFLNDNKP